MKKKIHLYFSRKESKQNIPIKVSLVLFHKNRLIKRKNRHQMQQKKAIIFQYFQSKIKKLNKINKYGLPKEMMKKKYLILQKLKIKKMKELH
jgi:hypothetical protein